MRVPIYQIDAFAKKAFEGNPAAVCPLDQWLPETTMQAMAAENNLSETVFFVPSQVAGASQESDYYIRWFTPNAEVKLCGHATLASAHVLFQHLGFEGQRVVFDSLSGLLAVERCEVGYQMDFPSQPNASCDIEDDLVQALGARPVACLRGEDYMAVFESAEQVQALAPNFERIKCLEARGVTVTAIGSGDYSEYDFVSRFFAPAVGIDEDPVTGSSFSRLIPYWAQQSGKNQLQARQISARGGDVGCELRGERVIIRGSAQTVIIGEFFLETE